jgi:sortase family protein
VPVSNRVRVPGLGLLVLVAALPWLAGLGPAAAARPVAADEPPAPPARVVLPAIGVDAPVAALDLADDGTMPAPARADLVGWYTFSAPAGGAGNTVLAGHRDWQGRRGVFVALGQLRPHDDVWLQDGAGAWHRYTVAWSARSPDDVAPVTTLVGPTERPALTLITCTGAFDRARGRYLERQVVRAELADADPAAMGDPEHRHDRSAAVRSVIAAVARRSFVRQGLPTGYGPKSQIQRIVSERRLCIYVS